MQYYYSSHFTEEETQAPKGGAAGECRAGISTESVRVRLLSPLPIRTRCCLREIPVDDTPALQHRPGPMLGETASEDNLLSPFKCKALPDFCIINRPFPPPIPKAYLAGQAIEESSRY